MLNLLSSGLVLRKLGNKRIVVYEKSFFLSSANTILWKKYKTDLAKKQSINILYYFSNALETKCDQLVFSHQNFFNSNDVVKHVKIDFSLNIYILILSKLNNWPHFGSRTLHILPKKCYELCKNFAELPLQKTLNLPNIYRRDLKWWLCRNFAFLERFLRKSAKKSVALANSELLLNNRPNHSGLVDLQSQCVT